ncbi:MAG: FkbM family methyltransferase [Patescibacteria group bacterium]|nr:FkbM family methyltransferase [Patescibacteria group bacterium]MDE2101356.1 FkbM family methyltransferase [Patescibacteria group bacterium]
MGFEAFKNNKLSFKEALLNLLPSRFKSRKIKDLVNDFTTNETRKALNKLINIEINTPLKLFDKKVCFVRNKGGLSELVRWVNEVVIADQYHIKKYIKPEWVVIDAGANIGIFSIFVANLEKTAKVFAFEPAEDTFSILVRNTQYYNNITCYNFGLGDVNSIKNFLINKDDTSNNKFEDSDVSEISNSNLDKILKKEKAEITSIDNFVRENGLSRVDFIKIDTEGYEEKILKGATETIKKFSPIIAVSAYHKPGDKKEIPKLIKSINPEYVIKLSKRFEEDLICYVQKGK